MKPCTSCEGSGKSRHSSGPCPCCEGKGYFPPPNLAEILSDVSTKGKFRKSPPPLDRATIRGARAYYVWRMARFHGGADVTMPVVAMTYIHGDPYREALDKIAEAVARRVFGTDMAAAYRWGQAMGYDLPHVDGLPATAYTNGPVLLDGDKPEEELPELL